MKIRSRAFILCLLILPFMAGAQQRPAYDTSVKITPEGKLTYLPDANGDRVPDFSYCGYMLSETPIPDVPVKVIVPAMNTDATKKIQSAIDYVSSLPLDAAGFRGTVLLEKG